VWIQDKSTIHIKVIEKGICLKSIEFMFFCCVDSVFYRTYENFYCTITYFSYFCFKKLTCS